MERNGIPLAAGSDGPVEDPNPMEGVWSAVDTTGLTNEESLTVGETLAGLHNRRSLRIHSESQPGTIELGKRADFVVVDP